MLLAAVSKLKIHNGDPVFDRLMNELEASQEEGLLYMELDVNNLPDDIRIDLVCAMEALGYEVGYSEEEQILEVWYEN